MTDPSDAELSSRRNLLRVAGAGAAGGTVMLLAGCGKSATVHARLPRLTSVPPADVPLLQQLLDLEHAGIAAYTAAIPLLRRPAARPARRFLSQELSHTGELAGLIKKAHAKPHRPRPSYDLGHPRTESEVLRLLERVELAQLTAYDAAVSRVTPGPVRAALGAIVANDAQHLALIRSHLGEDPVPDAFASGRE